MGGRKIMWGIRGGESRVGRRSIIIKIVRFWGMLIKLSKRRNPS